MIVFQCSFHKFRNQSCLSKIIISISCACESSQYGTVEVYCADLATETSICDDVVIRQTHVGCRWNERVLMFNEAVACRND
eukprot:UN18507